ncbi:Uncharacterised protein [Bordetella pertussis]|nr:Uncharacterised protein [Bordetella pertussis]CPN46348.1 Uncharacterised protein [Bordetella pertussis]
MPMCARSAGSPLLNSSSVSQVRLTKLTRSVSVTVRLRVPKRVPSSRSSQ